MNVLRRYANKLLGAGEYAVTIPSMDGALRPNSALDAAETLVEFEGVDNLVHGAGTLHFSSGRTLYRWRDGDGQPEAVDTMASDIAALAYSDKGELAVALDTGGIQLRREGEQSTRELKPFAGSGSATAIGFDREGVLHACIGSHVHRASEWKRDLMSEGSSGSVWRIEGDSQATCLADRLAFPNGIAFDGSNRPVVSEAGRHQLLRLAPGKTPERVLTELPAYPSRLTTASDGGYWLALFAPRSQMIEFVLREPAYRQRMIDTIDERYWMAPTLRGGHHFKEPLQGGGVKHLGIHKPWGPTRSYGLVARLDRDFIPTASMHSRTDGNRHGVTSCLEIGGRLLIACKGDGALIRLELPQVYAT